MAFCRKSRAELETLYDQGNVSGAAGRAAKTGTNPQTMISKTLAWTTVGTAHGK
jgi:hypothetical protein